MDNYGCKWCSKWLDSNINIIMADFYSKYTGEQVEEMFDQIANGEIGGGGVVSETDPIFSASPAASITEEKKTEWDNKVDKVGGKQLSTEDFTSALKTKLEGLSNYDDTELSEALSTLRGDFDKLVNGDTTTAIKTFNEVVAFLDGISDSEDLANIIASIEQQIAGKMDEVTLATVATSGSYNDLSNKPTIPSAVTESTVSGWGFTKNTGTYSKPSSGIPKSDLASAVQTSLGKADTALQSYTEKYKGTVTKVKINGSEKSPDSNGLIDLGTIEGEGTGEDIRYFTDFTVEDFIEECDEEGIITENTTELFNAMKSNKVICVPYRGYDKGFIVASYKSGEDVSYPDMYLQKGGEEYHAWTGDENFLNGEYPEYNALKVIEVEVDEGQVGIECNGNRVYKITEPVNTISVAIFGVSKPSTIQFVSGNSGTTINTFQEFFWANGEMPPIEPNTWYELSVVNTINNEVLAVLTSFKPVES